MGDDLPSLALLGGIPNITCSAEAWAQLSSRGTKQVLRVAPATGCVRGIGRLVATALTRRDVGGVGLRAAVAAEVVRLVGGLRG